MKLLCQIKNTMSDRAATETKFKEMLQQYRTECLPLCQEGWDDFTQEAGDKLCEMNNFFCELHLLTSMAETVADSFKKFKDLHLGDRKVGATIQLE